MAKNAQAKFAPGVGRDGEGTMAALSEFDLQKIMGDDYKNIEQTARKAVGAEDTYRDVAAKIGAIEDRNFSCYAAMIVGVALAVSAWYTAAGNAYWIQLAIAVGFVLLGAFGYLRFRNQLVDLREKLNAMQQKMAANAKAG